MLASANTRNSFVDVDQQRVRLVKHNEFSPEYHAKKLPTASATTVSNFGRASPIAFARES
jgi:hypothetical protein